MLRRGEATQRGVMSGLDIASGPMCLHNTDINAEMQTPLAYLQQAKRLPRSSYRLFNHQTR